MKRHNGVILRGLFFLLGWQLAMQTTINSNHKQILRQIQEVQTSLERQLYELPMVLGCKYK